MVYLLEAHFENPLDFNAPIIIGKQVGAGEPEIRFQTEGLTGIKCKVYEIVIYVYSDATKSNLIGEHRQLNLSNFDIDKVKSIQDLFGGTC